MLGTVDAFKKTTSGSIGAAGIEYSLVSVIKTVPSNFQYLISGRLIIDATSILRVDGQVVVI